MGRTVVDIDLKFNADISAAQQSINNLKSTLSSLSAGSLNKSFFNTGVIAEMQQASYAATQLQTSLKAATNVNTGKLNLNQFNSSLKSANANLGSLMNQLVVGGVKSGDAFRSFATAVATADTSTGSIVKKTSALGNLITNFTRTLTGQLSTKIINSVLQACSSAVSYIESLNKSLNNIRIVTSNSTYLMDKFAKSANAAAQALGSTTTAYTNAALIYYQQGLSSDADIQGRTETTIKMANITGDSAATVSEQLTAIWNNFDDYGDEFERYADIITALGAATASSTDEISEGLGKFAAAANTVGLSYDYATSALATLVSTTRESPDTIGTALKTLFTRLQGLKLGETQDDGVSLNKYSSALASVGVNILDASGEMKTMNTILDETAAKWRTLSDTTKMALAQTVAGTRQYTVFMSLMDNWDQMEANLDVAANAEGTVDAQNQIYLESVDAAKANLKAALQELYSLLIDDDALIWIKKFETNIVQMISNVIKGAGNLRGILITISTLITNALSKNIIPLMTKVSTMWSSKSGAGSIVTALGLKKASPSAAETGLAQLKDEYANYAKTTMGIGSAEADAMGESYTKLISFQTTYAQNVKNLTPIQREQYEILLKQAEVLQQQVEAAALAKKEAETSSQNYTTKLQGQASAYEGRTFQGYISETGDRSQGTAAHTFSSADTTNLTDQGEQVQKLAQEYGAASRASQLFSSSLSKMNSTSGTSEQVLTEANSCLKTFQQTSQAAGIDTTHFSQKTKALYDELTNPSLEITAENFENIKEKIGLLQGALSDTTGATAFSQAIDNLKNKIRSCLGDSPEAQALIADVDGLANSSRAAGVATADLGDKVRTMGTAMEHAGKQVQKFTASSQGYVQGITSIVSAIMSAIMAINTVGSIVTNFKQGNISAGIMSLIMTLSSLLSVIRALSTGIEKIGTAAGKSMGQIASAMKTANWIVLIITVIASIISAVISAQKAAREAIREANQALIEQAQTASDAATANIELNASLNNLINQYKTLSEAGEDTAEVEQEIIEKTKEMAEALGIVGADLLSYQGESGWSTFFDKMNLAYQQYLEMQSIQMQQGAEAARSEAAAELSSDFNWLKDRKKTGTKGKDQYQRWGIVKSGTGEIQGYRVGGGNDSVKRTDSEKALETEVVNAMTNWTTSDGYHVVYSGESDGTPSSLWHTNMALNNNQAIQQYYELQAMYMELATTLTNAQKNTEAFQSLQSYINDYSSIFEQLNTALSNDLNNNIALQIQNDIISAKQDTTGSIMAISDVLSQEDYNNYITTLQSKLSELNPDVSAEQIASAVDSYIANSYSNLDEYRTRYNAEQEWMNERKSAGIDEQSFNDWDSIISQIKQNISTELTDDEITDIVLTMNPYLPQDSWTAAFNWIAAQAEENSVTVTVSAAMEGQELLDESKTTIADWQGYWEKYEEQIKEVLSKTASEGEFLALSFDEKQQLVNQIESNGSHDSGKDGAQTTSEAMDFLETESGFSVDNWNDPTAVSQLISQAQTKVTTLDNEIKDTDAYKNAQIANAVTATMQQMQLKNVGTVSGLSDDDINTLVNTWGTTLQDDGVMLTEDIAANKEAITKWLATKQTDLGIESLADAQTIQNTASQELLSDSTYLKNTAKKDLLQQAINQINNQDSSNDIVNENWHDEGWVEDTAEREDLELDDISEFASYLRSEYADAWNDAEVAEEDQIDKSMRLATALTVLQKGFDSLCDNIEDYKKNLVESKRGTAEYNEALQGLRTDTEDLLGINMTDFDSSWFEDNIDLLEQVSKGGEEAEQALLELRKSATNELVNSFKLPDDVGANLSTHIAALFAKVPDLEIGATFDESGIATAFNKLMADGELTAEQVSEILSSIGWSPEISYVPLTLEQQASAAAGAETEVQVGDKTITFQGTNGLVTNAEGKVSLPVINADATTYVGKGSGLSSSKKKSGGGSSKKTKEKKQADNSDRYHTVDQQLEDISNQLDELSSAEDRAFGYEKVNLMAQELAKLNAEVGKYGDKLKEANNYLAEDKAKAEEFASKIGMSIEYGANGEITNWDALKKGYLDWYNAGVDSYNSGGIDDDAFDKQYEEVYDDAMDAFDQLEETNNLVQELKQNILDAQREYEDMYLSIQKEKLELNITLEENDMKMLEYFFDKLNDDLYDSVDRMSILEDEVGNLIRQASAYESNINNLLGSAGEWQYDESGIPTEFVSYGLNLDNLPELLDLSDEELYNVFGGEGSNVQEIVDQLQNDYENLISTNQSIAETREKLISEIGTSFDSWNQEIDDAEQTLEDNASLMEHYRNVIDIVGRKTLGITSDFIKDYNMKQLDNDLAQLTTSYAQLNEQRAAVSALEQAIMKETSDETRELMQNELDEMQKTLTEQAEDTATKWEECMRGIQEAYEDTVSVALDDWKNKMAGLAGSADNLSNAFDMATELDDNYLEDYDKIYELTKLSADINNSIDDTDNLQSKQDLIDLMTEVNELNESDADISQYTLDILQARYDLLKAEEAFKEAQNAKSTVRLTQDNEGNWGYVYTADQDAVTQAEQEYADKLHALEEINQNYIDDLDEKIANLSADMADKIQAIAEDTALSFEERKEKMEEVYEAVNEQQQYLLSQTTEALEDAQEIYEIDAQKYSDLTGAKMLDDEKWTNSFEEMKYSQIAGFQTLEEWDQAFGTNWQETVQGLENTTDEYVEKNAEAFSIVGMDINTASEDMSKDLNEIAQNTDEVKSSIEDLADAAESEIQETINFTQTWSTEWSKAIDAIVAKNEMLITSCDSLISKLADAQAANDILSAEETELMALNDVAAEGDEGSRSDGGGTNCWVQCSGICGGPCQRQCLGSTNKISTTTAKTAADTGALFDLSGDGCSGQCASGCSSNCGFNCTGNCQDGCLKYCKYSCSGTCSKGCTYNCHGKGVSEETFDTGGYTGTMQYADTGMYTGSWPNGSVRDNGRLAFLHQKELVLNAHDTENFLSAVDIVRSLSENLDLGAAAMSKGIGNISAQGLSQETNATIDQNVSITAEFPNVQDRNEIEEAFNNLINKAAQYANRKR